MASDNDGPHTTVTVSHRRALRSRVGSNLLGRLLCVPRIVSRIYVVDLPRSDPMELNDRLAFGPRRVFHASGIVTEGASREFFRAAAIERFSSRAIQCSLDHSATLSLLMGMPRGMICV